MSNWKEGSDGEDDDEEENENDYKTAEDRIIFLIDARSNMFEKNALGEIHFENCVKVALAVMKTKIVASDKSSIGIIFFGTKNNSSSSLKGIYSLFSLDPPSASRIRELQESVVDDISIFHNKIGSAPSSTTDVPAYCPLNEAFWACSGAFSVKSQSHKQNDFRRIWLFTNDDSPNANMSVDQDHIIQASRDCSESGIELSLWHMNRANKPFDPSKFYTKLLTVGSSNDNTEGGDDAEDYIDSRMRGAGYDGFDMMMANVRRREHRKRKLGSHMMTLGREYGKDAVGAAAEVQIALQMYKTVSITKRPGHTWLFSGTNEPLKSKSRMYHGQTGATLDDSMIETFVHLNEAARVPFTADELTAIKQSRGTGIELLYFTNQSELTPDLNISTPYFMFPDEKRLQGSTALFAALVEDMVQKDLIAVVRFVRSKAAMPRLAAMIPQMEYLNKDGIQMLPLGMHLVQLPFSEEISLKHHEGPLRAKFECKEAADAAAVAVVKALTIDTLPYNLKGNSSGVEEGENEKKKMCYFRDIGNPGLQRFYSVLQAIALMEDLPSDQAQREQDLLKPYFLLEPSHKEGEEEQKESFDAVVRKRAILNFKQAVGLDDDAVAVSECPKTKKRVASELEGGAAKKGKATSGAKATSSAKATAAPSADPVDLPDFSALQYETLPVLKIVCQSLGLPTSGTKKALIARIAAASIA